MASAIGKPRNMTIPQRVQMIMVCPYGSKSVVESMTLIVFFFGRKGLLAQLLDFLPRKNAYQDQ